MSALKGREAAAKTAADAGHKGPALRDASRLRANWRQWMEIKLSRVASIDMEEPGKVRIWFRRHRDAVVAWTFLTPMVAYFAIMTFVPMAFLIVMSFTNWNLISPPVWAGLHNLKIIFSSYQNWFYLKVIGRTIVYGVTILSLNVVGGFLVALVLNQNIRFKGIFRTMWYLPAVFSGPVIALLLKIYLQGSSEGVLNLLIGRLGFQPIDWVKDPFWMPIITVLYSLWQGIGFTVIFFLAGLQGVDENLYDAAKIDGANDRQLLRHITIPQMTPVLLFISVTGLIGSMQMWEVPRLITGGGPSDVTYTLVWSIQNDTFGALQVGLGTAQSLVLFVLLLGFIGWQLNRYRQQYNV
jgi:multiple sugar transport system permease protein